LEICLGPPEFLVTPLSWNRRTDERVDKELFLYAHRIHGPPNNRLVFGSGLLGNSSRRPKTQYSQISRVYTSTFGRHQTHGAISVKSQPIFKILSLPDSLVNLQ